jgi:hypothetical protein
MTTMVYQFGCRMSVKSYKKGSDEVPSDKDRVLEEMERGRKYYNALIDAMNVWLAGPKDNDGKRTGGFATKADAAVDWLYRDQVVTAEKRKALKAKVIYRAIRKAAFSIRRMLPAGASGCYKGTYDEVCADFERAVSDKRKGVWPGEPFRYRGPRETIVGCRTMGSTWGYLQSGKSHICNVGPLRKGNGSLDEKYFDISLRVTKDGDPIVLSVALGSKQRGVRRTIPDEAEIAKVRLVAKGDYATGLKFVLQVTAKVADEKPLDITERVGVDIGWEEMDDGGILVACTSDGERLVIDHRTVDEAKAVEHYQSLRDTNKGLLLEELIRRAPQLVDVLRGRSIPPNTTSAARVAHFCESLGIHGVGMFLDTEHRLRCTQEHCRRRYQNIRDDMYKKFAYRVGPHSAIVKLARKAEAEGESKRQEVNHTRQIASTFVLSQLLRNKGALEVVCERPGDPLGPSAENATRIKEAADKNVILVRPARRTVRKYRKRKAEEA